MHCGQTKKVKNGTKSEFCHFTEPQIPYKSTGEAQHIDRVSSDDQRVSLSRSMAPAVV